MSDLQINQVICGDCLEVLKTFPDNSIDSIITDPPYELGFMGKEWDKTGIANNVSMWAECLRVLKPGGHLMSFGGTRTYHRMACAIEDAGFEVRDMIEWVYSTGFPKSLNVEKQLIKMYGATQESEHNLRPMPETDLPQEGANKKTEGEILQSGLPEQSIPVGSQQFPDYEGKGQPGVERRSNLFSETRELQTDKICEMSDRVYRDGEKGRVCDGTQVDNGDEAEQDFNENGSGASYQPRPTGQRNKEFNAFSRQQISQAIRTFKGVGTALKPAHEPICLARKPLSEKSVAENCLKWGTGGLDIDGCRVATDKVRVGNIEKSRCVQIAYGKGWQKSGTTPPEGRFPANLIHDNSEEVRECFPETKSPKAYKYTGTTNREQSVVKGFGAGYGVGHENEFGDSGSASRFFKSILYYPKASKSEMNMGCEGLEEHQIVTFATANGTSGKPSSISVGRDTKYRNNHPTVKPITLMEYLIEMASKEGQIILDPFAGSGTTLVAAKRLNRKYIGIEKNLDYIPIVEARTNAVVKKQEVLF